MTDELVTDSGGIAHRLTEPPREVTVDLSSLESERRSAYDVPARPLGVAPYLQPGQVVTWHYGLSVDVLRVVRDDARGIVAWLPSESEQLASLPVDGLGVRDRPLAQRFTAPREMRVRTWWGPGILRIAPAGRPWSIWYFRDEQGRFQGHYVNLELVHERPVDGSPRVHTRDLVLDLWLEDGHAWLKDADELAAAVDAGRYTPAQAQVIRDIAERARREQIDPGAWPLDEGWEEWQPPVGWEKPLRLPRDVISAAESVPSAGGPRPVMPAHQIE